MNKRAAIQTLAMTTLMGILGLGSSRLALAGSASATMMVGVTIQPRALLTVDSQPDALVITGRDVERGYVDVPAASRISVRSNSSQGYLLMLDLSGVPIRSVEVQGLGTTAQVSATGGWIARPYTNSISSTAELSYRFLLAGNALPGSYAWPVALSATPK